MNKLSTASSWNEVTFTIQQNWPKYVTTKTSPVQTGCYHLRLLVIKLHVCLFTPWKAPHKAPEPPVNMLCEQFVSTIKRDTAQRQIWVRVKWPDRNTSWQVLHGAGKTMGPLLSVSGTSSTAWPPGRSQRDCGYIHSTTFSFESVSTLIRIHLASALPCFSWTTLRLCFSLDRLLKPVV